MSQNQTIDMTPTWGEFGGIYTRLAESGETKAVRAMRKDVAKAMAAAQAFQAIRHTLTDEQLAQSSTVLAAELAKQGF